MGRPLVWILICAWGTFAGLLGDASGQSALPQQPSDWDLYMLQLVNAARTNPAGENALRGTNYSNPPVGPLAYDPLVGRAAANHNGWMLANIHNSQIVDNTNTTSSPDSFSHHETLNAQSGGTPATGTAGYTGANTGNRLTFTGFQFSSWGENIIWSSFAPAITESRIRSNHVGWWNSAGHRNNLMRSSYTVMGHDAVIGEDHFATQVFSRPGGATRTYLLGVLYDDLDNSGAWEPRPTGDANREGLGGVPYRVFHAGTGDQVGEQGHTFTNGGFSFRVGEGTYDVEFAVGETLRLVQNVVVSGVNVDLGHIDLSTPPLVADYNNDGNVGLADYNAWRDRLGDSMALPGDTTPGEITVEDYAIWRSHYGETNGAFTFTTVPEPAGQAYCWILMAAVWLVRRSFCEKLCRHSKTC